MIFVEKMASCTVKHFFLKLHDNYIVTKPFLRSRNDSLPGGPVSTFSGFQEFSGMVISDLVYTHRCILRDIRANHQAVISGVLASEEHALDIQKDLKG